MMKLNNKNKTRVQSIIIFLSSHRFPFEKDLVDFLAREQVWAADIDLFQQLVQPLQRCKLLFLILLLVVCGFYFSNDAVNCDHR